MAPRLDVSKGRSRPNVVEGVEIMKKFILAGMALGALVASAPALAADLPSA
jgi:hypothetical protein